MRQVIVLISMALVLCASCANKTTRVETPKQEFILDQHTGQRVQEYYETAELPDGVRMQASEQQYAYSSGVWLRGIVV